MNIIHFIEGSIGKKINWDKPLDHRTGNNFLKLASMHNIPYKMLDENGERFLLASEIIDKLKNMIDLFGTVAKHDLSGHNDLYALDFIMDFVWLIIYWQSSYSKGFKITRTSAYDHVKNNYIRLAASGGIVLLSIGLLLLCVKVFLR